MKYRNSIVGYPTSKDYKLLWQLMQIQSVICFMVVQCGTYIRKEMYQTLYDPTPKLEGFWIGQGLIYAKDEKRFIRQCKKADLEFIIPTANQEELQLCR